MTSSQSHGNDRAAVPSADERVTELEIRLAYQDHVISALDEVVRVFTRRVEDLERTVTELRDGAINPPTPMGAINEAPPHY